VEHPLPVGVLSQPAAAHAASPIEIPSDSNVEMTWQVFGGEAQELYLALLKERCERDGLGASDEVLLREFRLHLHRGISYLATPHAIRSIADLVRLALDESPPGNAESSDGASA
jgi:DNA sulfur modification protein DndE